MKVVQSLPPNFEDIIKAFPSAKSKDVIFTYGDTVYVPNGGQLSPALLAHESVHSERQGSKPDKWWEKYLENAVFRFGEELIAHETEYLEYAQYGRNARRKALSVIALRLSSPLYGSLITFNEAKRAIKGKSFNLK